MPDLPDAAAPTRHLWEYRHPFYGADGTDGDETDFATFAELRECLDGHPDDGSTVIYRFDWIDWPAIHPADRDSDLYEVGSPVRQLLASSRETFYVFGLLPRTGRLFILRCPISKDQEDEVRDWLRGPRMLGALQQLWAPALDTREAYERVRDTVNSKVTAWWVVRQYLLMTIGFVLFACATRGLIGSGLVSVLGSALGACAIAVGIGTTARRQGRREVLARWRDKCGAVNHREPGGNQ